MEQATTVDFSAVARVSRYAELKDVRLINVLADCDPKSTPGPLDAEFSHESSISGRESELLQVVSSYQFNGRSGSAQFINIAIKYLVSYSLNAPSTEPLAEEDVSQFAMANATLHSWPFVRETLHSLTYKMGFPPFKLGVMHFVPQQQKAAAEPQTEEAVQPKS